MMTDKKEVALYVRVSTKDKQEEQNQIDDLTEYCKKSDWFTDGRKRRIRMSVLRSGHEIMGNDVTNTRSNTRIRYRVEIGVERLLP